jgi:hypothetical protein
MTTNNLFVFDENGKVKNIIRSTGKGPGEFFQMDGFQVTEDRIYIQDTYLRKNLEYKRDGSFVGETKNRFNNADFYVGDDYSLYFLSYQTDFEGFNFIRKDHISGKHEGFLEIRKELENLTRSDNRNGIQENIEQKLLYFTVPHSTKVVTINKNTGLLNKTYKFDFGKYNLEDKRRSESRRLLNGFIKQGNLVKRIYLFHPLTGQYFLNVKQGENRNHFIFMNNDFSINYQGYNLENDIDGMNYRFPWTATDNQLIFRFNSREFYNRYIETFTGMNVRIDKGNIHDFFQKNKENLKEDKWVLVKLKISPVSK